jgi:hypothetical protein
LRAAAGNGAAVGDRGKQVYCQQLLFGEIEITAKRSLMIAEISRTHLGYLRLAIK